MLIDKEKNMQSIRKRAEAKLDSQNTKISQHLPNIDLDETKKIVHELEVHQIELEMQNEELIVIQEALERTKKRYFDLYDMAPIGYCSLNQDGLIEEANLAISSLLGIERNTLIKKPLTNYIFQEDQDIYYMYRKKFSTPDEKQECELRMIKADSTPVWVHLTAIEESNTDEKSVFRLVISDISERKIFEEKRELAASVFKNAGEAIMITDLDGNIIDINKSFTRITGYTKEEAIDRKTNLISSGQQSKAYSKIMWEKLKEKGTWTGEIWNKRKNGQIYAEMLIINTVYDFQGKPKHYVALFSDITGIKEYENSLKNIAHYDQLTSLPNRVLLSDRLESGMIHAKRNKNQLAVIFLDLDDFKEVNDTFGHEVGDKLLVALAEEMKQALREGDTLARIGGDEFVAVLFGLSDISDSFPIITRILKAATKKVEIDHVWIQISASLGVTSYPQDQTVNADQLLRQADQAMYEAKLSGKNSYHIFNTKENILVRNHFEDMEEIRKALSKDEFVLYYQPKINMRTGEVIGVEALIRWQHPVKGILSPVEFLPVITGHVLEVEIGKWVMHTALLQIKLHQEQGINIPISINIGARQLLEEGFVDDLKSALLQYPTVAPDMLELEVLESTRLEDILRAKDVMHAAKSLGVTFSLDDFGTGYSSLTYLKQLPINQIKIDQSFVRDMLSDPDDLSILEGIVSLSHAFHRTVIAEGVETSAHAIALLQLGCELGQGYEIAHPMPELNLKSWLEEYKPNESWKNYDVLDADQRQILFIKVQHRAWIKDTTAILKETKQTKRYSMSECSFGQWLKKGGRKYLGKAYKEVDLKHKNIHVFADKLINLYDDGHTTEALAGLDELYSLRDELLAKL